jgi:hypothetical protein
METISTSQNYGSIFSTTQWTYWLSMITPLAEISYVTSPSTSSGSTIHVSNISGIYEPRINLPKWEEFLRFHHNSALILYDKHTREYTPILLEFAIPYLKSFIMDIHHPIFANIMNAFTNDDEYQIFLTGDLSYKPYFLHKYEEQI